MKNLPIVSGRSSVNGSILPPVTNLSSKDKQIEVNNNSDASVIEVMKVKPSSVPALNESEVLQSFLTQVKSEKDLTAAHSGLDASRVFDLLNDPD